MADPHRLGPTSGPTGDAVETALARALHAASAAGRFDVVAQLAKELEARRLAREPNVMPLAAKKHADETARIEAIRKTKGGVRPTWVDSALRAAGVLKEGETL